MFFLFEQKTAYEMSISDWSSDVCSSYLSIRVGIESQHDRQRLDRHLVDAHFPLHRVALDARDQIAPSDNDSRLRSAEQLVAAEGDEIGPVGERHCRRRFVGQAIVSEVDQRAASKIDDEG